MNHQEFEDKLLDQTVGQTIQRVTYFELNDPQSPVTFNGFDCCDLGIEIELSNGFRWHISWKEFEFIQVALGPSKLDQQYDQFATIDVSDRWNKYTSSTISGVEIVYLNEEWRLPSRCKITFSDGKKIQIVIGKELNADGTLPAFLEFVEPFEIYIFYGEILTEYNDVRIEFEPFMREAHSQFSIEKKTRAESGTLMVGLYLMFIGAIIILAWWMLKELLF